jgi:hypothetical protein
MLIFMYFAFNADSAIADQFDADFSNCEIKQISTGKYFFPGETTGSLDFRNATIKIITACLKQSNAWIDKCIEESGATEGCTKQSLLVTQILIKDAWLHRDNLTGWAQSASK